MCAKIRNSRTLLRRNWRAEDKPDELLDPLKNFADKALRAADLQQLLGIEGAAAALNFGAFDKLIKKPDYPRQMRFDFESRNRRPPTDPELIALLDGVIHHSDDHVLIMDISPADGVAPQVVSLSKDFEAIDKQPVIV
ncbi:MAG: CRISPR-associated endonuclease Cas1 [Gammaproteobacteria bacterium]